ncbi:MAG: sugar ABC transporter substrate-binding protein [Hormoscilla sp.]
MKKNMKIVRPFCLIIFLLLSLNIIAGCQGWTAAKDCKNVAILLPKDQAERYEKYDYPMLKKAIESELPGVNIQYFNAKNIHRIQEAQAETALNKRACILVLDPVDREEASEIVQTAKEKKVPVVAYDRIIQDNDTAFYVSFNGVQVGELQGEYIVEQYQQGGYGLKKGAKLVMIHGAPTDNNAKIFSQGVLNKLQPLIDNGDLVLVSSDDEYTPYWDRKIAGDRMEELLKEHNNDIQIAYVANDNMANSVIEVLRNRNLNGKVLVTGQDATVQAIQNILKGDQAMTVYKPIREEARKTAEVVAALSKGMDIKEISNGTTKTDAGGEIPSFLLIDAIAIDKSNISIVIEDGFVTKAELCEGITVDTGGICE